jgi:hypothetical protein
MGFLMSTFTFIIISLTIALVVFCTVIYVRDLKGGKDSFWKKTGQWLKNIIDVLFGAG